jgi:hypothetical protein
VPERHGGPFKVEKNATGAVERDAMRGEGVQDFCQRQLDILEGFHAWEAGAEDVGATEDSSGILAAFPSTEVEITELLAVKGGGAAGKAIFFEMVTGTVGHESLQKTG